MQPELTLHCFAGDTSSLAVVLLADYLGVDLKLRYLKPVNVTEKFYKASLTRKFPMLEVRLKDSYYLIERSSCIMRFLTETARDGPLSDKKQFGYAIGNQNLDFMGKEVMPALLTARALCMGVVEEDKELEKQVIKDTTQRLTELDTLIASQTNTALNHSDFLLFVALRSARDVPQLQPTVRRLSACKDRWERLAGDERFKALYAPYALRP